MFTVLTGSARLQTTRPPSGSNAPTPSSLATKRRPSAAAKKKPGTGEALRRDLGAPAGVEPEQAPVGAADVERLPVGRGRVGQEAVARQRDPLVDPRPLRVDPQQHRCSWAPTPRRVRGSRRARPRVLPSAMRSVTRFVAGSIRSRRVVDQDPHGAPAMLTSACPPTGTRATTRRVRGSTRSTSPVPWSTAQTRPKPGATTPPVCTSCVLPTTRGPVTGGGSSPRSASAAATAMTADQQQPADREHGRRRGVPAHRAGGAPHRPAPLLPLRGVEQLVPEPAHEVLPHRRAPIRARTAARPRLTRLRTTASETCVLRRDVGVGPLVDDVRADRARAGRAAAAPAGRSPGRCRPARRSARGPRRRARGAPCPAGGRRAARHIRGAARRRACAWRCRTATRSPGRPPPGSAAARPARRRTSRPSGPRPARDRACGARRRPAASRRSGGRRPRTTRRRVRRGALRRWRRARSSIAHFGGSVVGVTDPIRGARRVWDARPEA